jgi:8-oxo-dGTP pyrophosphatase MutT (NUDIX family)
VGFPWGGFVEENETLEQAAQRELEEETGIKITAFEYIGSFSEGYNFRDEIIPVAVAVFVGKVPIGTSVTVGDDVSDYTFVAREDLDLGKIAFDKQRAFAVNYLK